MTVTRQRHSLWTVAESPILPVSVGENANVTVRVSWYLHEASWSSHGVGAGQATPLR